MDQNLNKKTVLLKAHKSKRKDKSSSKANKANLQGLHLKIWF